MNLGVENQNVVLFKSFPKTSFINCNCINVEGDLTGSN